MTSAADRLAHARSLWNWVGDRRPDFAVPPQPGQESVWDYPRPPRVVLDSREVIVRLGDTEIARTRRALRVLETASPPTFYLPQNDVHVDLLVAAPGASFCEWKGEARYWSVVTGTDAGQRLDAVAWSYDAPLPDFAMLRGHIAFYPQPLACLVNGVPVKPQPGRFYAGWITPEVVGPFKGEPGSGGW